jgi:DNA-binding transcriptional MocR family regulator
LSFNWGGSLSEDDLVVTAGCMEAISFCLQAVTKPGDAVATESPTFYGIFRVMQSLGLKVVEVPTDPVTGIDLNYLQQALDRFDIKACVFVPNFNNPLGSCVPDERKKTISGYVSQKRNSIN